MANADRLEQIIVNLLTNAYRYGGETVVMEAAQGDSDVQIAVSDNGDGVDAELVPHLFEPFTRGAKSSDVGGSGLGLTIAQRLARAGGGDLCYEPAGGGARFVVHLPRAVPA
jgi:signal transduction histidine kinase